MAPFKMNDHCPVCQQNFMPEPGFYYGAMFLSYIGTGFFALFFLMFFNWVLDWSMTASIIALLLTFGLLFVWIFRIARSLWLSLNVSYDPEAGKKS